MDSLPRSRPLQSPRDILKSGALAVVPLAIPFGNRALQDQQAMGTETSGKGDRAIRECRCAAGGSGIDFHTGFQDSNA
jgi:hypothetical protein